MKKKNKFMESLGIGKDKKVTIAYYLFLVFMAVMVFGNMILPFSYRMVSDISCICGLVCAAVIFVRLFKNSKNKSKDDDNEAKKW